MTSKRGCLELEFEAIAEDLPGAKWKGLYDRHWQAYERWYLQAGERARPTYLVCRRALREHMPRLLPTWEKLTDLAGGGDVAARFLSFYCPPPYLTGCSQAVWSSPPAALIRNYDYHPELCEGVILKSAWNGRRVIAMNDCLWGVLDGVNEEGLAVSLSFGGRTVVGEGFGVPIVLRYLLEFCSTTEEATAVLARIPVHMSYNVTVLDRSGSFATVYVRPDKPVSILPVAVTTNHQEEVEWHEHAKATGTVEREQFLCSRLDEATASAEQFIAAFLRRPVYSQAFERGYGTLYTAAYQPAAGSAEYLWPGYRWPQSFAAFEEGRRTVRLGSQA